MNNPGRLGSVEIKTRTVSTSEDAVEEKEAKKGNNKKEKNKFQSGFKPQKGQKSEPNKGGGRAGSLKVFPPTSLMTHYVGEHSTALPHWSLFGDSQFFGPHSADLNFYFLFVQLLHGRLRRRPRSLIMSEERKEK